MKAKLEAQMKALQSVKQKNAAEAAAAAAQVTSLVSAQRNTVNNNTAAHSLLIGVSVGKQTQKRLVPLNCVFAFCHGA
jgi:hypothetical protein